MSGEPDRKFGNRTPTTWCLVCRTELARLSSREWVDRHDNKAAGMPTWHEHQPPPEPPDWVAAAAAERGVTLAYFGALSGPAATPIWACMGDCCCWFVVDDSVHLDRYSLANTGEPCQGQDCACHTMPLTKQGDDL